MSDKGEHGMINSKGKGKKRSEIEGMSKGQGEKKRHSFLS